MSLVYGAMLEGHNPTGVCTYINLQTEAGGTELFNYASRCSPAKWLVCTYYNMHAVVSVSYVCNTVQ